MIESFKICAVAILFTSLCVVIKHFRAEFIIPTRVAVTIIICGVVITLIDPIIEYFNTIMGQTLPLEYMKIILKSLAIAFIVQISSEICRDCGENNIASGIETIGKIEIILLSLPMINNIISMSRELLSW